jgi:glycine dehydrogenase subunit 1
VQKAHYAAQRLSASRRFALPFQQPFFKEFVVRDSQGRVPQLLEGALNAGFLAGIPLGRWYAELDDCFLVTVTEKRVKAEIDALAECLASQA